MSRTEPVSEMSLSEVLPGAFPPEQPTSRRRGAARAQRKRKKRRRQRSLIVILMSIVLVGGGVVVAWLGLAPLIRQFNQPNDYSGAGTGSVTVTIPEGASGRKIAQLLTDDGVVKTPAAFLDAAGKDPRSSGVQPGAYGMRHQMSGAAALSLLLDPTSKLQTTVTIPEGMRVKDILAMLAKKLRLDPAALKAASTSADIGLPKAANGRPEGFLFPATYTFQPGQTATQVLSALVARGENAFTSLNIPPSQLHDVVIKASIVQAEAGKQKYMGKVARVLDNRLAINMPLGLDSTISYATGKFNVTTTPADRRIKSVYNTYLNPDLPGGPISNPGEDALKAVLHPTPGQWLYFVTINPDTGETKFAVTDTEATANRQEFQAWLRAHPQGK